MTEADETPAYRIVFKTEGEFLHAYVAPRGSMEGAELIATMRVSVLQWDPTIQAAWRALMYQTVNVALYAGLKGKPRV